VATCTPLIGLSGLAQMRLQCVGGWRGGGTFVWGRLPHIAVEP
jgi:hypothetical protein